MANWKDRLGVLYSTNPDYQYQTTEPNEETTLAPEKQPLRISISRKHRSGKEVTLITGFVGTTDDLEHLGKLLKQRCGVGGSIKDGEVIIQGDQRTKLLSILQTLGYQLSRLI